MNHGDPDLPRASSLPRHVAIITDGNGRWAHARGLSPTDGHDAGADTLKARLRDAAELGSEELADLSVVTVPYHFGSHALGMLSRRLSSRIASFMTFSGSLAASSLPRSVSISLPPPGPKNGGREIRRGRV